MPKIAINISPIFDGNSIRGVGYYTTHLIESIQQEIKNNKEYRGWSIKLIKKDITTKSGKYDLVHYPFFDPFSLTLKIDRYIPTIVTVHDLIPREFKKQFPVGIKGELKWFVQKNISIYMVLFFINLSGIYSYIFIFGRDFHRWIKVSLLLYGY
jgi:hypothetical protein